MRNPLLISAVVAATLFVGHAFAADLAVTDEPAAVPAAGFDWEGGYIGVHTGAFLWPDYDSEYGLIGAQIGYNFLASESILAGVEASAEFLSGTNGNYGHFAISGRVGLLASDSVLIYGVGELGTELTEAGDNYGYYGLGAGVEFAATDAMSIRAQVLAGNQFDNSDTGLKAVSATVGVNFHF